MPNEARTKAAIATKDALYILLANRHLLSESFIKGVEEALRDVISHIETEVIK